MTDHHHPEHRSDAGFERQDLTSRPIYGFLISLAVIGVLVYYVIWGVFWALDTYNKKNQPPTSPLVQVQGDTRIVPPGHVEETFPEPRLEVNERAEINDFRLREEQALNSTGWVDQSAGVVHIPITRAMELIAQRGLPTNPKTGTVPSSPVNLANQAAAKSDTSGMSSQKKNQTKGKSQ